MINVRDYGALGEGGNYTSAFLDAIDALGDGGALYVPSGVYQIDDDLVFTAKSKGVFFYGDGPENTLIYGSTPGNLVDFGYAGTEHYVRVEGLTLIQSNAQANSALRMTGVMASSARNCRLMSYAAHVIDARERTFTVTFDTLRIQGVGNVPIGMLLGGHSSTEQCDIVGCSDGWRVSGTQNNMRGGRIEVNRRGIVIGENAEGMAWLNYASVISGVRMEANDIAVDVRNQQGCRLEGVSVHGSEGSPGSIPGQKASEIAFLIEDPRGLSMASCQAGGTGSQPFSEAGFKIPDAPDRDRMEITCSGGDNGTGPVWDVAAGTLMPDIRPTCWGSGLPA